MACKAVVLATTYQKRYICFAILVLDFKTAFAGLHMFVDISHKKCGHLMATVSNGFTSNLPWMDLA